VRAELVDGLDADDHASGRRVGGLHGAAERQRQVRVRRGAQPDAQRGDQRLGSGPVGDVALHVPERGVDVEEDVLRPLLLSQVAVVVHVLEVAGRDGAGDDVGRRQRQAPQRQRLTRGDLGGRHGVVAALRRGRPELRQADRAA
jgi:hypothetical protein